ncbi:hypothetical protein NUACC21_13620 [Scytonema sp. NUACC21]
MTVANTLAKATLIAQDGGGNIEFMFNPTQLAFEGVVETAENSGARTQEKGKPKVSFSNIKAYKITISNILFDTYEEGADVNKYIEKFKKAVEFAPGQQRPPIYQFVWGKQVYLRRCFVEKLNYKLTMFLPDGTPVRAVIDSLTLKEADEAKPNAPVTPQNPTQKQRQQQSMSNMKKNAKR